MKPSACLSQLKMNSYEVNSEKLGNVGSRHGSRDSREYQKLAVSLAAAENKQKKLEENIRNLRSMVCFYLVEYLLNNLIILTFS